MVRSMWPRQRTKGVLVSFLRMKMPLGKNVEWRTEEALNQNRSASTTARSKRTVSMNWMGCEAALKVGQLA